MKNTFFLIVAASALFVFFRPSPKESTVWELDKANAKLTFSLSRLLLSPVMGQVKSFDVKVTSSREDFTDGVVEMSADVNSITTGNHKRDIEVKGPNYFDLAKFPTITFKSNSFRKMDDRNYKVLGILTMHGITRPVTVDVVYSKEINPASNKTVTKFKSSCKINRDDFKIGSGGSSALVGKEVQINAETEFVKVESLK